MYNCLFPKLCTDLTEPRPQELEVEVGFSHYLTLNWINVNKLRLCLDSWSITKIEFLTLNWIIHRIQIITVGVHKTPKDGVMPFPPGYIEHSGRDGKGYWLWIIWVGWRAEIYHRHWAGHVLLWYNYILNAICSSWLLMVFSTQNDSTTWLSSRIWSQFTSNFMQGTASLVATASAVTQRTTSLLEESVDISTVSCNETLALLDSPSSDQLVPPSTPSQSSVETVDHDTYDMQFSSSSPSVLTSVQFPLSLPSTPDNSLHCLQHAKSDNHTPQLVI